MIFRLKAFLLSILLALAARASAEPSVDDMKLSHSDSTYRVNYSFAFACDESTAYAILHDPAYIRQYLKQDNLKITVVDSAHEYNRITYRYNYLISALELTMSRKIESNKRLVSFQLDSSKSYGSTLVPSVVSTYGYYKLFIQEDSIRVDYYQQTSLDRKLNSFYLYFIRRDTWRFFKNLHKFLDNLDSRIE